MANPKTTNLNLNKVDRTSPTTTTFNTKPLIDDNMDIIDGKFGASTGHGHTGVAGDGPKIGSTGLANGAATDTVIGSRTTTDSVTPGFSGTLTALLSGLFTLIKGITGKSSALTAPATTLEAANTHIIATTGVHGAVSTATASKLMIRDSAGRAAVVDPAADGDIVNRGFLYTRDAKDAVRAASTANITLSATQTIDGVALAVGDRVLVKNQTTAAQNGVYVVAAGSWTRSIDADTTAKVTSGMAVRVLEGSVNQYTTWQLTTTGAITIGTTSLAFAQVGGTPDDATLEFSNGHVQQKDGGTTDAKIGNRTITDTTTPAAAAATLTSLLGQIGNMLKGITGKSNWYTAPAATLEATNNHINATAAGTHGSAVAATANTLMHRDANGRAKVAAPSASDDIAIKSTVDAAITTAAADATTKANAAAAASVPLTQKGAVNGVAPLGSDAKIAETYLPDSIIGQVEYQGTWNATTNTPALPAAAAANKGWYFVVATAGTYNSIDFQVGDWIISNGLVWQKVDNTDAVPTVFGRTGNIVAATNDYTWAQINKATSSLADITTRSASDLSSGTLPAARLPAIGGDITIAAGSNSAAITAGAIIDSDINASAGIAATKIGSGSVSNAEFGYLDGVTSGIQGQLDGKAALTTTPQQTSADITYYVRTDGNDSNNGLANTTGGAFRTITKALSMIPAVVNHSVIINVAAGTYAEDINVYGHSGKGVIQVNGAATAVTTHTITGGITGLRNSCRVEVVGFRSQKVDRAFYVGNCSEMLIYRCTADAAAANNYGAFVEYATAYLNECVLIGKGSVAAYAHVGGVIFAQNCSGSANTTAFSAAYGGRIHVDGTVPGATVALSTAEGGIVTDGVGVVNPWGDNTMSARPFGGMYLTAQQTINATTWTKMNLSGTYENQTGICDPANKRIVVTQTGAYSITARAGFGPNGSNLTGLRLAIYINGNRNAQIAEINSISSGSGIMLCGSAVVPLTVGDVVEIYAYSDQSTNISSATEYTHLAIIRVA